MSDTSPLLTPSQVAKMLNVNPRTVSRWAREGRIQHVRTPGGQHRFWRAEIDAYLEKDDTTTQPTEEQTA
jgi:excisionase family DNA binding protein